MKDDDKPRGSPLSPRPFDRMRFLFTMSDRFRPSAESAQEPRSRKNPFLDSRPTGKLFIIEGRFVRPSSGGARRDRTDDLMLAKHALSQLSYGPFVVCGPSGPRTLASARRRLRG